MATLVLDPDVDPDRWVACANRCFGHWGDRAFFDWCFRRDAGAGMADLLIYERGGEWVAGSAINYRRVLDPAGKARSAAIMTGSWTLPEARRDGLFSRAIEDSKLRAAERNADFLLGFVIMERSSRRLLVAAGSVMRPAWYLVSDPRSAAPAGVSWERTPDDPRSLWRLAAEDRLGFSRLDYPLFEHWKGQFLDRAEAVEVFGDGGRGRALVERGVDTDRLLLLLPTGDREGRADQLAGLLARSHAAGRRFFFYTLTAGDRKLAARLGMVETEGCLTILSTRGVTPPGDWRLSGGDRM